MNFKIATIAIVFFMGIGFAMIVASDADETNTFAPTAEYCVQGSSMILVRTETAKTACLEHPGNKIVQCWDKYAEDCT